MVKNWWRRGLDSFCNRKLVRGVQPLWGCQQPRVMISTWNMTKTRSPKCLIFLWLQCSLFIICTYTHLLLWTPAGPPAQPPGVMPLLTAGGLQGGTAGWCWCCPSCPVEKSGISRGEWYWLTLQMSTYQTLFQGGWTVLEIGPLHLKVQAAVSHVLEQQNVNGVRKKRWHFEVIQAEDLLHNSVTWWT